MRRPELLESPYAVDIMRGLGRDRAHYSFGEYCGQETQPMYGWTVTPGEIKQRRIKAKAQKAARKVNRRSGKRGR